MTKYKLIIFALGLLLFNCDNSKGDNSKLTLLVLIDNQTQRVISDLKSYRNADRKTISQDNINLLKEFVAAFSKLRNNALIQIDNVKTKMTIDSILSFYGKKFLYNPMHMSTDLDTLTYQHDGELKIALIQLNYVSIISNKLKWMLKEQQMSFKDWKLQTEKLGKNEFKIYLTPVLAIGLISVALIDRSKALVYYMDDQMKYSREALLADTPQFLSELEKQNKRVQTNQQPSNANASSTQTQKSFLDKLKDLFK